MSLMKNILIDFTKLPKNITIGIFFFQKQKNKQYVEQNIRDNSVNLMQRFRAQTASAHRIRNLSIPSLVRLPLHQVGEHNRNHSQI